VGARLGGQDVGHLEETIGVGDGRDQTPLLSSSQDGAQG
jgi:hypothetical protein